MDHETHEARYFSRDLMCPKTGISYPNPEPNNFSFNSPKGACPKCNGIGTLYEVNLEKIVPDDNISITAGGLCPSRTSKKYMDFQTIRINSETF